MIRFALPTVFILSLSGLAMAQQPQPDKIKSEQPAAPVCIYSSKSYSDGAYVCGQKSLMLKCGLDGAKATWSVVTDKDLSSRCEAPVARLSPSQQRARWYRRHIRQQITPPIDTSARCFNFNGKRYCE